MRTWRKHKLWWRTWHWEM